MATSIERVRRAVAQTPWAILPEKLDQICEFLALRAEGRLSASEIEAAVGQRRTGKEVRSGSIAVLPVYGTLSHRMSLMMEMSGGTSTEAIGRTFDALVNDSSVGTIVLDVDSPGGSVPGVMELSDKIHQARGSGKRIIAVANTLAASAAYWIASAADELVVTPSGEVGSVGVYMIHMSYADMLAKEGVEATIIRAGEHKAEGNPYERLNDDAKEYAQSQVDEVYSEFVGALARNRGTTREKVLSDFGQGRVLKARAALDAGMVDRIATLEEVLSGLGLSANGPSPTLLKQTGKTVTLGADAAVPAEEVIPATEPAPAAKEHTVENVSTAAQNGVANESTTVTMGHDALATERVRAREITEMAHEHGMADKAAEWIESGKSANAIGREILRLKGQSLTAMSPPDPAQLVDMTEKEQRRYSMHRALLAAASNDWADAGFELEIHEEIERKLKRPAKGLYIPTGLGGFGQPQAALTTDTQYSGQELVFTERGSFIEMLRSRLVTTRLGATFLPGLVGDVAFPRQTTAATLEWRAEDPQSNQSDSALALDQLVLSPKEAQATTAFSRKLLAQSTPMVEGIVRNDLAAIAARGVDRAALHGTGISNDPTGIYAASGVTPVAMGGAISYAKVVELETVIFAGDADVGVMGYATTPGVRGAAKTTQQFSGDSAGAPIWTGGADGEMNGYQAVASTQVSKTLGSASPPAEHGIIFGVWSELYIGEWGAMEIIVDPYTKKKQGLIEVTMHLMADVGLRHAEAFAKGTGLTVSSA